MRMMVVHLTKLVGPVAFGAIGTALGLLSIFWIDGLLLAGSGALIRSRPSPVSVREGEAQIKTGRRT